MLYLVYTLKNYLVFVKHSSLMEHGIFLFNISCNSIYRSEYGLLRSFYHLGFDRVYQDANILNRVLVSSLFLLLKQISKYLLFSVKTVVSSTVYIHLFLFINSTPNGWHWAPAACLTLLEAAVSGVPKTHGSSLALDCIFWFYFWTFTLIMYKSLSDIQRSIRYAPPPPASSEDKVH